MGKLPPAEENLGVKGRTEERVLALSIHHRKKPTFGPLTIVKVRFWSINSKTGPRKFILAESLKNHSKS
jgi:hypothetical protein